LNGFVSLLLADCSVTGIDHSDLFLVHTVMKFLSIKKIVYHKSVAGNATGHLFKEINCSN